MPGWALAGQNVVPSSSVSYLFSPLPQAQNREDLSGMPQLEAPQTDSSYLEPVDSVFVEDPKSSSPQIPFHIQERHSDPRAEETHGSGSGKEQEGERKQSDGAGADGFHLVD